VAPPGQQYPTGPAPFGIAISPSGKSLVIADIGAHVGSNINPRPSLTVLEKGASWEVQQLRLSPETGASAGVSTGVAFSAEHSAFVAEGNSGRVALIDLGFGERRRTIDLDQNGFAGSFAGDLTLDPHRDVLYVADPANFRVAIADPRSHRIIASIKAGYLPSALALSPDRRTLYVANAGLFEYHRIPRGTSFPPFELPGDPNARESNSVAVVDVSEPADPKVESFIRTGRPWGDGIHSGSSPSGIVAAADRVYVANAANDSITVIDAHSRRIQSEIPIRIPGLEQLRGILPAGLAFDEKRRWLLVAEAGINAIGVIDTNSGRILGHIPAGWYPTRVLVSGDTVFVANLRGRGVAAGGIEMSRKLEFDGHVLFFTDTHAGSVSIYALPGASELAAYTEFVMRACGFQAMPQQEGTAPEAIRHVVLIVKGLRSFDEILGDLTRASNGEVMAAPALAHLGGRGSADGGHKRLSLQQVNITPNHHAIAEHWAFSDNFYADSDLEAEGHRWLAGSYLKPVTESLLLAGAATDPSADGRPGRIGFPGVSVAPEDTPEQGTIWDHLAAHGISFYNFGEGLNLPGIRASGGSNSFLTDMPIPKVLYDRTFPNWPVLRGQAPDTERAALFVAEIERRFIKTGTDLPQFLYVVLPNDSISQAQPETGYPFPESAVADNDNALGLILEYLSGTPWWKRMVVFVTEAAGGGLDHIDPRRTVLLCAGPWVKRSYVSHTNTSFPGLVKTILAIFHLPSLNLFDRSAADLSDCFTSVPDYTSYQAIPVDRRIYSPASASGVSR
jgi:DNA-binding beta-propeller fold protein YncE